MKKFVFTLIIIFPILCLGQIIHIPGDYATIQEGIDAAGDFDTVLVAPGTYAEHLEWHNKSIVLASHFLTTGDTSYIENTVIDGTGTGRVLSIQEAHPGSHLCGFTITNGHVGQDWGGGIDMAGCDMIISNLIITNCSAERGGGMCITHSPTALINLQIHNNEAAERAAGIWMNNSSTYMADCELSENTAPLGTAMYAYINSSEALEYYFFLEECSFFDNVSGGQTAGLWIRNDDPINIVNVGLVSCSFTDNEADANAAMQIRGSNVEFVILNSRIMNNQAVNYSAGTSFTNGCTGEVVNTLFYHNIANTGGMGWNSGAVTVWGMGSAVDFINCTFTENSAAYGDAICVGPGSEAYLLNNIIWDNGNQPIALLGQDTTGSEGYLDYNDLQYGMDSILVDPLSELIWDEHNMTGDPLFEGSGDHPWAISTGSPCIDMGTPDTTDLGLPPFDIIGNFRIWDGGSGTARIDIGAYEYGAPVWVGIEDPPALAEPSKMEITVFPNPARDHVSVHLVSDMLQHIRLDLYALNGQKINCLMDGIIPRGMLRASVPLTGLPAGIYLIRLQGEKDAISQRLVIY